MSIVICSYDTSGFFLVSQSSSPGGILSPSQATSRMRLPTEPIGNFSLTLTNVVSGSVYDVEIYSTGVSAVPVGTAAGSTVTLNIPVYATGDPKNTLRIKVRKGTSSPYYQPYETQIIASVGSGSLFINQVSDES